MTRTQKSILLFLSLFVCAVGGVAIWLWRGEWQQPLGPALHIPTVTPFELASTWTPDPEALAAARVTSTVEPHSQASPIPTLTANVGLCGAPPVMNILAIGTDA